MIENLHTDTIKAYHLQDIASDIGHIPFSIASEESWLRARQTGIGGSEIGVVLGLNEYSSKLELYKRKKADIDESVKSHDTVYTRKGKALEGFIMDTWVHPYFYSRNYHVCKPDKIFTRYSTPWILANLDGLAVPKFDSATKSNIVVEIKWVSQWATGKWDYSAEYCGIPPSYYAQVQQYMYTVGADNAVVFALFDDVWECEVYNIPRNDRFIERIVTESNTFYHNYICMDIPPKPDVRFDKTDIVTALETLKELSAQTPSVEMGEKLAHYKVLKDNLKDLEKDCTILLNELVNMYLEGYVPTGVPLTFKMSKRTTTTIDTKTLRELYPEIAKQCSKTSEYTVHSIKEIK